MKFNKKTVAVASIFLVILISVSLQTSHSESRVPLWVKNTAKWFSEDKISEGEFVNALQYLINNGIIVIQDPKQSVLIPESDDTKEELLQKGISLLESQNNEQALMFFDEALKKDPESIRAISDKGIILARQGKFVDAKKLFDTAISVSEKKGSLDYRPIVNAGIILSIYGDPTEAIQYFDRVLDNRDKAPKDVVLAALVNKGVTLFEDGKYEESITYFDQALEIEPNRLGALVNKANALQELGQYKEALKFFEKAYAIDKDPLSWKPRYIIVKTLASVLN